MKPIDYATQLALAVKASVNPKTMAKALRGESVRGLAGHRIRAVLEAEGLLPKAPAPTEGAA